MLDSICAAAISAEIGVFEISTPLSNIRRTINTHVPNMCKSKTLKPEPCPEPIANYCRRMLVFGLRLGCGGYANRLSIRVSQTKICVGKLQKAKIWKKIMLLIFLQPCNNTVYKAAGKLLNSNAENLLFVAGFFAWYCAVRFFFQMCELIQDTLVDFRWIVHKWSFCLHLYSIIAMLSNRQKCNNSESFAWPRKLVYLKCLWLFSCIHYFDILSIPPTIHSNYDTLWRIFFNVVFDKTVMTCWIYSMRKRH